MGMRNPIKRVRQVITVLDGCCAYSMGALVDYLIVLFTTYSWK
jgi:hypothetical protein